MTRVQKESIEQMLDYLMFPTRFTKSYSNVGNSYPPYNIVKASDNSLVLEVAVAGFKEEEVSVVVEDGYLRISGKKTDNSGVEYLYKGIGTRSFERSFALSKDAIVQSADYNDGILSILVEEQIPEEKKSRQIPIKRNVSQSFLTE
jgi:molecular chaperone IbpA